MEINMDYDTIRNMFIEKATTFDAKQEIAKAKTFRDAAIIAKSELSPQAAAGPLESWVKARLRMTPALNGTSGDGVYQGSTIELKQSLGGKTGSAFNFVQIRPDHDVDNYIFTTYDIFNDDTTWFNIPADDMHDLIVEFGGYAHGTIKALGPITADTLKGRNCEYAIRPSSQGTGKKRELWDCMLEWQWHPEQLKQVA